MDVAQRAADLYWTMAKKAKNEEMRNSLLQRAIDMEKNASMKLTNSSSRKTLKLNIKAGFPRALNENYPRSISQHIKLQRLLVIMLSILIVTNITNTIKLICIVRYPTILYNQKPTISTVSSVSQKQVEQKIDCMDDNGYSKNLNFATCPKRQFHPNEVLSSLPVSEVSSSWSIKSTTNLFFVSSISFGFFWIYVNYINGDIPCIVISVVYICLTCFVIFYDRVWPRYFFPAKVYENTMIILLDPTQSHVHLRELFDNSFMYLPDTTACIQYIRSHERLEISLFLSLDNANIILAELRRNQHVILYIFYSRLVTQAHGSLNLANPQIRFSFHESQLCEFLYHASIIQYSLRAGSYRQFGYIQRADAYYEVARRYCDALTQELKNKIDTQIGTDAQDLPDGVAFHQAPPLLDPIIVYAQRTYL